jgi:hypothetical protein
MNLVDCRNSHYIASYDMATRSWEGVLIRLAVEERDDAPHKSKFCGVCGVANLIACEYCHSLMTPLTDIGGKPGYCRTCGKPYPWTEATLMAAKEYTEELAELNAEGRAALIATFDDLVVDTLRTELAAHRFEKLIRKRWTCCSEIPDKSVR